MPCIPICSRGGRLFEVPAVAGCYSWDDRLFRAIRQGATSLATAATGSARSISPLAERALTRSASRLKKTFYPRALVRGASTAYNAARGRTIHLQPSDIILLMDSSWSTRPVLYEQGRRHGCFMGQIIYDLLPISHRQFFVPQMHDQFRGWLNFVLERVDCLWAISHTVRDELWHYYQSLEQTGSGFERGEGRRSPPLRGEQFRVFPLGADLSEAADARQVRSSLQAIFANEASVFSTVGTLEPRKNHQWILNAFDQHWQAGGTGVLVIAGRAGWLCQGIRERIESHPRYGSQLFWYDDANDDEVQYMYRHSKAVVTASHAEGFGLPIVESLFHGTPVLASDTRIHREVGGDKITYFSLTEQHELVSLLQKTSTSPAITVRESQRLVPTWSACTHGLIQDVMNVAYSSPGGDTEDGEEECTAAPRSSHQELEQEQAA